MTRAEALKHMQEGGKVKHSYWPGKVLSLDSKQHIRVDSTGYGLHWAFHHEPKVSDGWEKV